MLRFAGRRIGTSTIASPSLLSKSSSASSNNRCFLSLVQEHARTNTQRFTRRPLTVAILRETYDKWERRAPLSPKQVAAFLQDHPTSSVLVQPSSHRIFSDQDYQDAGATIQQDVRTANVVLAVKRPKSLLEESLPTGVSTSSDGAAATVANDKNKQPTYLFFSHVRKGQPENMGLLQECLDKKVQLIDYECITTSGTSGTAAASTNNDTLSDDDKSSSSSSKRLVAFGKYAGMAGMLDTFSILGKRLLGTHGTTTPFLNCPPSIYHSNLENAKDAVRRLGDTIATQGLAHDEPIVICVTGGKNGNVHGGVREILDLLPHEVVKVEDLPGLLLPLDSSSSSSSSSSKNNKSQQHRHHQIYVVGPELKDLYQRKESDNADASSSSFDKQDFYKNPEQYTCKFAENVAPYCHVLMNCIYWDHRYPRLLTKEDMLQLYDSGNQRLMVISDISCDINGSIGFLDRSTTIDNPCYQYDPITGREISSAADDNSQNHKNPEYGVTMMGVDILPTELPLESSIHFGTAVGDILNEMANAENSEGRLDHSKLSPRLTNAIITTPNGELASNFKYLKSIMKRIVPKQKAKYYESSSSMTIMLEGHLFDSGLINQVLDTLDRNNCVVEFQECHVQHQKKGMDPVKSRVILKVVMDDHDDGGDNNDMDDSIGNGIIVDTETKTFANVESKIAALVSAIETADATFRRIDHTTNGKGRHRDLAYVHDNANKKVLLLGSGRVSKSVVDFLGRSKNDLDILVASNDEKEAREVASFANNGRGRHAALDVSSDGNGGGGNGSAKELSEMISEANVVISLLPVPMHPRVAELCIENQTDLVTASYESDAMRRLDERAKAAGIRILNEVGLDPGLDHMSAMRIIDDVRDRGGEITSFSSVCGGLPAPEAADNPLRYKFSWSPSGVISASQAPAKYRWEGHIVQVNGNELLQSAAPFMDPWPVLRLECLPNRDSLSYEQIYGIDCKTMFRGTLRYRGFSSLLHTFQNMGLFETTTTRSLSPRGCTNDDSSETTTWSDLLEKLRANRGFEDDDMDEFLVACAEDDQDEAIRAKTCLEWLQVMSGGGNQQAPLPSGKTVVDLFCERLQEKLLYGEHERDMVLMHHTIGAEFDDGSTEEHHSSLQTFGDESMSAMCKTVGYTCAASTELVLNGSLKDNYGLLLPTEKKIYTPVLGAMKQEGIVFEENVKFEPSPYEYDKVV